MDRLAEQISAEFALGVPLDATPLAGGGPQVLRLRTTTGSYVLKPVRRAWELELYSTVERGLNVRGVRQAALFRTAEGAVVGDSGYSVQELLPGSIALPPSTAQRHAFFEYLARYDRALADIPAPPQLQSADTVFNRVTDPQFLIDRLPGLMREYAPDLDPAPVSTGLTRMAGMMDGFLDLPAQVVHGDHGPDNVLYDGDAVVAIIDFSPYLAPVLFGLGTALYWFHVHGSPDLAGIEASLAAYAAHRPLSDAELRLWPAMLLREGLRRLTTPLAVQEELGRPAAPERLQPRYAALRSLIDRLPV